MPSTSISGLPIMKSMWIELWLARAWSAVVVEGECVGRAEGDMAGRVLVVERVVEDRAERADSALAVDQRDLTQPGGALVPGRAGAQHAGALVGVDVDRPAALEPDAQAADHGALDLAAACRGDRAVHPRRVGVVNTSSEGQVGMVLDPLGGAESRRPASASWAAARP